MMERETQFKHLSNEGVHGFHANWERLHLKRDVYVKRYYLNKI